MGDGLIVDGIGGHVATLPRRLDGHKQEPRTSGIIGAVDRAQISAHLATLDGVREQATGGRTTWRVQGRLVGRLEDDETLLVRSRHVDRERLVRDQPDVFYVTPAIEAHHKVLVHLPAADPDDVRRVLSAAWELQHRG